MVSENPLRYLPQNYNGKNIYKNIALLHSFATGLEYLVGTSGHKQPSSFLLPRDLKAPCTDVQCCSEHPALELSLPIIFQTKAWQ